MEDRQEATAGQSHRYQYSFDPESLIAPARVVRMVGCNKRVLELGSGPGSMTQVLSELNKNEVTALELDAEAVELVRPFCKRVFQTNLNDASWPSKLSPKEFETVIAADVLEHVYEPVKVLNEMVGLMADGGSIVISLPHIGHATIGCCLLSNNFRYSERGLLDETHIRFFSLRNIQDLVEAVNLKIVEAEFVTAMPEGTEFADLWSNLDSVSKTVLLSNPFSLVYQVVFKAVPLSADGIALDLLSLPVADWEHLYGNVSAAKSSSTVGSDAIDPTDSRATKTNLVLSSVRFIGRAVRYIGRKLP